MANEPFSALPTVANSLLADIVPAIQGGVSVQETLQQVFNLMLSNIILHNSGNPNGSVSGSIYQLCWDTSDNILYVCTTTGSTSTAVWTQVAISLGNIVTSAQGGTGISNPTIHTLPIAQGASNFNFVGPLTNGQLLVGSTGIDPVAAGITAGTNIGITNGAGTITINATNAASFVTTHVTGTSQSMSSWQTYVADNGSLVTLTLPAMSAYGDQINIVGKGAGGWSIAQGASQSINLNSSTTTVGVGGSASSTNANNCLILICTNTNLTWTAISIVGTITVV